MRAIHIRMIQKDYPTATVHNCHSSMPCLPRALLHGSSYNNAYFSCLSLFFNNSSILVHKLYTMCQNKHSNMLIRHKNNPRNFVVFNILRFLFTISHFNLFQHGYQINAQKSKLHFKKMDI